MPHLKTKSEINWHYELEGEGEVLFFIHGWGVDKRIWRQQTKHFVLSHKILSIDLPGHGESSFQKISFQAMADDVLSLIDHLGIKHLTIIGSSLGGLFGLKLFAASPEKFKRLVFVGSMPKFAKSSDYPYGLDIAKMKKLSGQLNTAYPSIINIFFRSLFTKEERESRRFKWLQKFREFDAAPIRQALVEYLDVLEHEDLRNVLREIKIPVNFINGSDDPIAELKTVKYLMQSLPQAQLDVFENCGHFPFLSKPHEFNEVLERLLKQ